MATTLKASSTKCKPAGATNPARTISGWTTCGGGIVFLGGDDASDGSALTAIAGSAHSGTLYTTRLGVWIYGPIAAQTISGTITATIRGRTTTFANMFKRAYAAYIMKPCGTLRHTLITGIRTFGCFETTCFADATDAAQCIVASAVATAGDYVVLEAGANDTCFVCSDTARIEAGSTGPHMRWVFSGTILLQTGVNNSLLQMGYGT
jgi:hypothetical protein